MQTLIMRERHTSPSRAERLAFTTPAVLDEALQVLEPASVRAIEDPAGTKKVYSTLIDYGIPGGDSAMARTVSLPVAIAGRFTATLRGMMVLSAVPTRELPSSRRMSSSVPAASATATGAWAIRSTSA